MDVFVRLICAFALLLSFGTVYALECNPVPDDLKSELKRAVEASVTIRVVYIPTEGDIKTSHGSGFILNKRGYIQTVSHIADGFYHVEDLENVRYEIFLSDCRKYTAELVFGGDEIGLMLDMAIVKIINPPNDLVTSKFNVSSSGVKVGDRVFAIGTPYGSNNKVSPGKVVGLDMEVKRMSVIPFIYADTRVMSGNSGGALVNSSGEVVGLTVGCDAAPIGGGRSVCVKNGYFTPVSLIMDWFTFMVISHD